MYTRAQTLHRSYDTNQHKHRHKSNNRDASTFPEPTDTWTDRHDKRHYTAAQHIDRETQCNIYTYIYINVDIDICIYIEDGQDIPETQMTVRGATDEPSDTTCVDSSFTCRSANSGTCANSTNTNTNKYTSVAAAQPIAASRKLNSCAPST